MFHIITVSGPLGPKRRDETVKCLEGLGIEYRVHTFQPDTENPVRGCYTSHQNLYRMCIADHLPYITVCEDNIVATGHRRSYPIPEDFDTVLLGAWFLPFDQPPEKVTDDLYSTDNVHGLSCYIISQKACRRLADVPFDGTPIDILHATILRDRFLVRPLLFHHRCSADSIVDKNFSLPRKVWFSPSVYHSTEKLFFSGYLRCVSVLIIVIIIVIVITILYYGLKRTRYLLRQ